MAEKDNRKSSSAGDARSEESYRAAKLIRSGSRELSRQYNSTKTKRQR